MEHLTLQCMVATSGLRIMPSTLPSAKCLGLTGFGFILDGTQCTILNLSTSHISKNHFLINICRALIHDIGLLRLSRYISSASNFPSSVGTICLPTIPMPENEELTATGWGGTNNQLTQSPELKEVMLVLYLRGWRGLVGSKPT